MEIAQEKLDLIKRVIRNNSKFSDNEDLYDDFFNETCKRSLGIINVISAETTLEAYLKKVATTSILSVLKDSGRLRRTRAGYEPVNEVSIDESISADYSKTEISYKNFIVEKTPEDLVISSDTVEQVAAAVLRVNMVEPEKQYLQIYKLRYDNGMTQKEIADEMGLSQSEVSKRLFKLMKKIKQSF